MLFSATRCSVFKPSVLLPVFVIQTSLPGNFVSLSVFVCQDSDRSGDVGVFNGRHCGVFGLLDG